MYYEFSEEVNYKEEIMITVPQPKKQQVEFIAILPINSFPLIIVICECIYQHINLDDDDDYDDNLKKIVNNTY